jgi:L-lysine exporter family protein LysE/ArgO
VSAGLAAHAAIAAKGFGLGAGLIIAIGAQNAYVLRQGLRREHVFVVATVCFLCDVVLIAAGAAGVGTLVAADPTLTAVAAAGGAAFLLVYGLRALRAAWHPKTLRPGEAERAGAGAGRALAVALALSLLNPHVYLDTVVLLGSVAGQYSGTARSWFAGGAMAASMAWFYGLGYGAGKLAPLFRRPAAWRVLDALIALIMLAIAASLAASVLA